MSVAQLLEGKRVCVCAGSGGVGKTTTSAAIALGMAAQGARVAVVTIDPAAADPAAIPPTRLALAQVNASVPAPAGATAAISAYSHDSVGA